MRNRISTVRRPPIAVCLGRVGASGGVWDSGGMKKSRGFTMIELSLAAPSFTTMIRSSSMTSTVNSFLSDLRFARSEGIRRGGNVVMCRSDSPEAASPKCGTGSGPLGSDGTGAGWVSGWIIFHDVDNSDSYTSGDLILRIQGKITNVNSILDSASTKFKFTATGRLQSLASGAKLLRFGSDPFTESEQRVVCVAVTGRARIAGNGSIVSCD